MKTQQSSAPCHRERVSSASDDAVSLSMIETAASRTALLAVTAHSSYGLNREDDVTVPPLGAGLNDQATTEQDFDVYTTRGGGWTRSRGLREKTESESKAPSL